MRPVRLELRGFTAFREPTVVDFEGRGLFVITGPTGAGKSSLLDAMMWALFGQVPRVGKSVKELVSQGEREMSALFEFTVRGRPYRVSRRHPGTTSTRLEKQVNDQWVPLADRAREVTEQVEAILGMDYATFTRAIVLPQGQFDSFLRGEAKDRRNILSQLIGLGVYERAGGIARTRAATSKTQAQSARTHLEQLAFATPEAIQALRRELAEHTQAQATLEARRKALVTLREQATEERERRVAADHATTAAAEAARDLEAARAALADATQRHADARARLRDAEAARAAVTYSRERHDELKAQVALLDQRVEAEAALATARVEAIRAEQAVRDAVVALDTARTAHAATEDAAKQAATVEARAAKALGAAAGRGLRSRTLLEAEIATLEADAQAAEAEARALEQRSRDLEGLAVTLRDCLDDRKRHADAGIRAAKEFDADDSASKQATAARAKAEAALVRVRDALELARVQDAAAHIRAGLKVGDPCPICGETIARLDGHAAPELATAERAVDEADRALATARHTAEDAAARLAAAAERTEATRAALAAVDARLAALDSQAEELQTTRDGLAAATKQARAQSAKQTTTAEAKRGEASARRDALQALRDVLARLPESIEPTEASRGSIDADALRAATEEHRAAANTANDARSSSEAAGRTLSDAERALREAEREHDRATKACSEAERRLGALGGADVDAASVRAALAECEQQARRVEEIGEALRAAREALASAEAAATSAQATAARDEARHAERVAAASAASEAARCLSQALEQSWQTTVGEGVPSLAALKPAMEAHQACEREADAATIRTQAAIERAQADLDRAQQLRAEAERHQAAADLAGAVATELQGNRFIAFLLNESMQLLATDASNRLSQFTNGRYELCSDDDAFLVIDRLNGDEKRSVKTLSGGETFLASLALALSLSEHLPEISGTGGAVSLDSLFLDEGFGALDSEALDLAVQGLETLAEGSRMIGVISHVEELAERLPDRIRVEKGVHGSTVATS